MAGEVYTPPPTSPIPTGTGGAGAGTGVPYLALAQTALGLLDFDNTFGSLFSNGLEFSCWNSTFTPHQTNAQVNTVHVPFLQTLFNKVTNSTSDSQLQSTLNELEKYLANNLKFFTDERLGNNWEKCSRQGLDVYREFYYDRYHNKLQDLIEGLETQFTITSVEKTGKTIIPQVYDKQSGPAGRNYTYKFYTVKNNAPKPNNNNGTTPPPSGSGAKNGKRSFLDAVKDFFKKETIKGISNGVLSTIIFVLGTIIYIAVPKKRKRRKRRRR